MPVFAEIYDNRVVGLALASDVSHARQRLQTPKGTPLVELPENPAGWSIESSNHYLFPLPLFPGGGAIQTSTQQTSMLPKLKTTLGGLMSLDHLRGQPGSFQDALHSDATAAHGMRDSLDWCIQALELTLPILREGAASGMVPLERTKQALAAVETILRKS